MISLSDASFVYAGPRGAQAPALDGVTLTVAEGEFVCLVGPNGSGKSTLAMLMNGLLLPTKGQVVVDGLSTSNPSHRWEIRRRVGMVFQNPDNQIVATLVEEDVAFGPENLGVPPEEIRRRVDEALTAVHMGAFARYEPHLLSGGQKQRVAVAGALALKSRYLVLDEPTSMLDPAGCREVLQTVRRLQRERGVTVVMVTHRLEEAGLADRVLVLCDGRLAADGPPAEVLALPEKLREWGLSVPPLAELRARLAEGGLSLPATLAVSELAGAIVGLAAGKAG